MITQLDDSIVLENGFLKIVYFFSNQKLSLKFIQNKITNDILKFKDSDEFELVFTNGMAINKHHLILEKYGKSKNKIRFYFKEYKGVKINYVVILNEHDCYFKTYLEIDIDKELVTNLVVDTIDMMKLNLESFSLYHNPQSQKPIKEMAFFDSFYANLGQPVYIDSFYFGNEFPINDNGLVQNTLYTKRYYGKSLVQYEFANDKYISEKTVIGVSNENSYDSVQMAFYEYLNTIKIHNRIRLQYNSWFDYMQDIDEQRIYNSFEIINNKFTQYGIPILHSFVIDDGWQNQASLWEIDSSKFPNGFHKINNYLKRNGSNLGLWFSPVGGYTHPEVMATYLEENNLGSFNYNVVNVADYRYIQGLEKIFSYYIKEYDLNYIKVDGMLVSPLTYSDEYFIGGGYNNMYSYTDTHERYLNMFKKFRKINPDLWINYTSYVNPSPFFLQYVNSLWMQCSEDVGFRLKGSQVDQMLSYRDYKMFEMLHRRKFQVPNQHLYNHDPVYGISVDPKLQLSDEDFRRYLYFTLSRGLLFNEFYYSYELFNDKKWEYNAEAIKWYLKNINTLQNAKLIGNVDKVYGYLSVTKETIILSLRNASDELQNFEIPILSNKDVFDYISRKKFNFPNKLQLKPYETLVCEMSIKKKMKIERVVFHEHKVIINFDSPLATNFNVYFNNEKMEYMLSSNLMQLTLQNVKYHRDNEIVVNHEDGTMLFNKRYNVIQQIGNQYEFEVGLVGKVNFALECQVNVDTFNRTLIRQKDNFEILINSNGEICLIIKKIHITLIGFKARVPQVLKLYIHKNENDSVSFYIDGVLRQKINVKHLNNVLFTKEKIQLSSTISNFRIYEK